MRDKSEQTRPAPADEQGLSTVRLDFPPSGFGAPPTQAPWGGAPPTGFDVPLAQPNGRGAGRTILFGLLVVLLIGGGGVGGYLAFDAYASRGETTLTGDAGDDTQDADGEPAGDVGEDAGPPAREPAPDEAVADAVQDGAGSAGQKPLPGDAQKQPPAPALQPGAQQVPGCGFDTATVSNWDALSDAEKEAVAPIVRFATSHNANLAGVSAGPDEAQPLDCAWEALSANYRSVHGLQRSAWNTSQRSTRFPRWTIQSIVFSGSAADVDVEFVSSQSADLGPDGQTCTRWLLSYRLADVGRGEWKLDERTGFVDRFASSEC